MVASKESTKTNNAKLSALQTDLLAALKSLPVEWVLTPVNGIKAPYRENWQNESPVKRKTIAQDIVSGKAKGLGLRTGVISGGLLAVDADGHAPHKKILELSSGEPLPETVAFTSNRPGRCQYLFCVPQEYWGSIRTKKIGTGVKDEKGKEEKLELRWDGCQSVVPPSVHPETGFYRWKKSPAEVAIAPAPRWLIEQMLDEPAQKPEPEPLLSLYQKPAQKPAQNISETWTDEERALSYLDALSSRRADDYDDWLAVGMALHSVSDRLFYDWDRWSRYSPKYKDGECEKKWRSFKRSGVAIGTLGLMAKQDGWESPFPKKSSGRHFSGGIGRGSGNGNGGGNRRRGFGTGGNGGDGGDGGDGNEPLQELSLRDRVLEILNRNQERSQREEAFINLAHTTGTSTKEIKELANSLETEVDLKESRTDRKAEIENLLRIGKYQLQLEDYLDPTVAKPLERIAGWMGTTAAAMLTTLYPVIGSLLKVGTQLELIKATDFYAKPVVYSGLVVESGAGKTGAQKTILKPLFALQTEAEAVFKEKQLQYKQDEAKWKKQRDTDEPPPEPPIPHEYYTTDATSEAVALIQSQQPNSGFLGWFDELPSLFKSQGQYKNGRGADGEKILSGRDGTGFKVNRASGKRLVVNDSAYSITGSLQPMILRQLMGDFTDANGQWARFLWCVMQVQEAPYPVDAFSFDISELLKGIYRRLKDLPATTYKLSSPALTLYRNWYNELDRLKMAESRQGLRSVYAKMKGDTGVLALILHCFNGCVFEGDKPNIEVSGATMAAAIKLAKYHIGQVKLIHSEGDVANGDLAAIHAKIIQLSERKGWLRAADVRDIDRQTKKKFSANDIRNHFRELEASGFGLTKGDGTRLMWTIKKDGSPPDGENSGQTQDTTQDTSKNAESYINQPIGESTKKTQDTTQGNSGLPQDMSLMAESNINQPLGELRQKTQDTQDTFTPPTQKRDTQMVDSPTETKIKESDPSEAALSCPEEVPDSSTLEMASVSAQDKTQDTCPKNDLSCPERPELSETEQPEQCELNFAQESQSVALGRKFRFKGNDYSTTTRDADGNQKKVVVANGQIVWEAARSPLPKLWIYASHEGMAGCSPIAINLEHLEELPAQEEEVLERNQVSKNRDALYRVNWSFGIVERCLLYVADFGEKFYIFFDTDRDNKLVVVNLSEISEDWFEVAK